MDRNVKDIICVQGHSSHLSSDKLNYIPVPIRDVHPFLTRALVTARVVYKSQIRTWQKSIGIEGKVCNVELIDQTGAIIISAFDFEAETLLNSVQIGTIYNFARFKVEFVNRAYNDLTHSCEMYFQSFTEITLCEDDVLTGCIPSDLFHFVKISAISEIAVNKRVDLIGMCIRICEQQTVLSTFGSEPVKKREIFILDDSNTEIAIVLWNNSADNCEIYRNKIIAVKRGKVFEYTMKMINVWGSSRLVVEPDIVETQILRRWIQTFKGSNKRC